MSNSWRLEEREGLVLLLLDEHLEVLEDNGDGQQDTGTRANRTYASKSERTIEILVQAE